MVAWVAMAIGSPITLAYPPPTNCRSLGVAARVLCALFPTLPEVLHSLFDHDTLDGYLWISAAVRNVRRTHAKVSSI